ncbi:MAG: hypothetical protein ACPGVU_24290, partial [Limisphaerales bacterium]
MKRLLLIMIATLLCSTTDAAQKKNNKQPNKTQATKNLNTAKSTLRDAQTAHRRAALALANARSAAITKHTKASGLTQAQQNASRAASNLGIIRQSVTERVRRSEDHIKASTAAKEAGENLRQLSKRSKMSEARKRERRAELSAIVRRPVEMER